MIGRTQPDGLPTPVAFTEEMMKHVNWQYPGSRLASCGLAGHNKRHQLVTFLYDFPGSRFLPRHCRCSIPLACGLSAASHPQHAARAWRSDRTITRRGHGPEPPEHLQAPPHSGPRWPRRLPSRRGVRVLPSHGPQRAQPGPAGLRPALPKRREWAELN